MVMQELRWPVHRQKVGLKGVWSGFGACCCTQNQDQDLDMEALIVVPVSDSLEKMFVIFLKSASQ